MLNCVLFSAMDRESLDSSLIRRETNDSTTCSVLDRFTNARIEISNTELRALCAVHLAEMLTTVVKNKRWGHRRPTYRHMANILGGKPLKRYTELFALETHSTSTARP